jgi:hypothetical protein
MCTANNGNRKQPHWISFLQLFAVTTASIGHIKLQACRDHALQLFPRIPFVADAIRWPVSGGKGCSLD